MYTLEDVKHIVADGESPTVEFKKTHRGRREATATLCGMLNASGGMVIFGVADDRTISGVKRSDQTAAIEDIAAELRLIEPQVVIHPEQVALPDEHVLLIYEVPAGGQTLYRYKGRAFVRDGASTRDMRAELQAARLLEGTHWDAQPAIGPTIDDLDGAEIERTLIEAIRRGRLNDPGTRGTEETLLGLGLLADDGTPLNAAVVLFGKESAFLPRYPQCVVRLARFRGVVTGEFEDHQQLHGNIFQLLDTTQSFLRRHLPVAGRIIPGVLEREDEPVYPTVALREAMANALCHRDYSSRSGSVSVSIFDDRLEIRNTGELVLGLSVEDLSETHSSRPRNTLVAQVLYKRGIIEQFGTGTRRIIDSIETAGLPRPEFESRGGEFLVRFHPSAYTAPRAVQHDLNALQRELLQVLADHGPIKLGEVLEMVDVSSRRTVQDSLKSLKGLGLVEMIGKTRGAQWQLVKLQ